MQLRFEIPDKFWGLFRSVNREAYMEALLNINEEYQYSNYFLTREVCIQVLSDMYIKKHFQLKQEEDETEFDLLETPASRTLKWLLRTGWLKKLEDYNTLATNIVIPDYAAIFIDAFERLFVIQDIEAWSPAIRSASAIRRGLKREFVDPSIAVAALGLSPEALYTDLKTFGFLFECMAIRDLKAYSLSLGGSISYYHDRYDLEADAVLHLDDGRYALIEFKLGSREIEEGAEHLKEIKRLVQEHNMTEKQIKLREPDLLMVITGGEMAYTRPDGVKIIPLACLKD